MHRLKDVKPYKNRKFALNLRWTDGTTQSADLSGLIEVSRHFGIFKKHPEEFDSVHVINWGDGVQWDNGLDYSAENLARIAAEQLPVDEVQRIKDFIDKFHLTNKKAAQALGYSVGQIKNFKSGKSSVPVPTVIAIKAMIEKPTTLYARLTSDYSGVKKVVRNRKAG